jgi:hypothetical protein
LLISTLMSVFCCVLLCLLLLLLPLLSLCLLHLLPWKLLHAATVSGMSLS